MAGMETVLRFHRLNIVLTFFITHKSAFNETGEWNRAENITTTRDQAWIKIATGLHLTNNFFVAVKITLQDFEQRFHALVAVTHILPLIKFMPFIVVKW